ncbi:hypothetical protein XENTR_v10020128 [Xenopus tropicalis]|nr:hypothetical protein XENTR_v10020128 [Xenopus tropicalis]
MPKPLRGQLGNPPPNVHLRQCCNTYPTNVVTPSLYCYIPQRVDSLYNACLLSLSPAPLPFCYCTSTDFDNLSFTCFNVNT